MTRLAKWIERRWHGPRTRKYDAAHREPTRFAQAMTTRRKP